MADLSTLKNIGPKTLGWLHEIGIHTREDLLAVGSVEAYKRLKAHLPDQVTLNALWGLEAAINDMDWRDLPPELKAELKRQVEDN